MTVTADNTAVARYLTLGHVVEGNMRVVKDGLTATDRIIVNGLMRARAGQKVMPQEQKPPASASAASPAKTQ